jgi:pyruvate dehydrogenase E1 component
VGATSGRTTLAGEGLQHQDGNSHLLAYPVPTLRAYDPAYAYEVAEIVREGIRRMHEKGENLFYYLTVGNEPYPQPEMPKGSAEGILQGIYRFRSGSGRKGKPRARILGSGAILNEAVKAQRILEDDFGVASDVWSVTSYKELHREGTETERWNLLHPGEKKRSPYLTSLLSEETGPVVAASDYVRALPDSVARFIPARMISLGTDGFGRSEARLELRRHFEVDAPMIALAALHALVSDGVLPPNVAAKGIRKLGIDPEKRSPL